MKQETKLESFAGFTAVQEERPSVICIPARIILNKTGVSFFTKYNQTLSRFDDSEGSTRFGFTKETVDFLWLKKMLHKGFVEKMEIKITEIAKSSEILGDVVRLVFFAMFRYRITLSVLDQVYNSPMLRSWNRANPKYSIGPGVNLSKQIIRNILQSFETLVLEIKAQLRRLIAGKIDLTRKKWDSMEKLEFFIDEIIRDIDPLVLFILVGSKEEDRILLLRNLAYQIISFCNMVDALDMASMLSVELASAAERSAMLRVMMHQGVNDLLKDISTVKPAMKGSKFRGTTVVFSVPRYTHAYSGRLKFRVSFYNDAADADTERRLMEDFSERSGRFGPEKKLDDFFQEEGVYGDNAMRFYYLTMLQELCEKHNIKISSSISSTQRKGMNFAGGSAGSAVTTLFFGL